jgi:cyclin A
MYKRESTYLPKAGYLEWQPNLNDKMRAILVDWLIQVSVEYNLYRETIRIFRTSIIIEAYDLKTLQSII